MAPPKGGPADMFAFMVLILPKWLIKVPGHIAILFGSFLELSKKWPTSIKYEPFHLFFYVEICQQIQDDYWESLT